MTIRKADIVVVGAGPAGLQLSYYLQRSGVDYLLLEKGSRAGRFFEAFPRHRQLISVNKIYTGYDNDEVNLRWDWNSLLSNDYEPKFKSHSARYFPEADAMVDYLNRYAERHSINVQYDTDVQRVSACADGGFDLCAADGRTVRCKTLVFATGVESPFVPDIEGIRHAEQYADVSTDASEFANARVLIIGKGNSAFETADNLVETARAIHLCSPNSAQMAWTTKYVGHLRAVNNNILDSYQLKLQNVLIDADILSIEEKDGTYHVTFAYKHAGGEIETLTYDRIICATGFRFDASVFDERVRPKLTINDRFPLQTEEWESVNVPNLYFAGTITQSRDFKQTQSGFIHGFRYNTRALNHVLAKKYYGTDWPYTRIGLDPEALTAHAIERVNNSSALWQQTGFIGDIAVLDRRASRIRYYEDIPLDIAKSYFTDSTFWALTLEFGKDAIVRQPDPFALVRPNKDRPDEAEDSPGLHPIIREYRDGEVIATHHVIEDIASEWKEPVHTEPLHDFLAKRLKSRLGRRRSPAVHGREVSSVPSVPMAPG